MKLKISAYHLGSKINLKKIDLIINHNLVRSEHSFLLYGIETNCYIYFKDYGSVVFINCDESKIAEMLKLTLNESIVIEDFPQENYDLIIKSNEPAKVDFHSIQVPEITLDVVHIIMLNLGQSVGLDYYFNQASKLLDDVRKFSSQLENKGRINLGRKKMRQFIGKTMNLKNRIADNLFIFDTSINCGENIYYVSKTDNFGKEDIQIKKNVPYQMDFLFYSELPMKILMKTFGGWSIKL